MDIEILTLLELLPANMLIRWGSEVDLSLRDLGSFTRLNRFSRILPWRQNWALSLELLGKKLSCKVLEMWGIGHPSSLQKPELPSLELLKLMAVFTM